jgi:hypothetical protein
MAKKLRVRVMNHQFAGIVYVNQVRQIIGPNVTAQRIAKEVEEEVVVEVVDVTEMVYATHQEKMLKTVLRIVGVTTMVDANYTEEKLLKTVPIVTFPHVIAITVRQIQMQIVRRVIAR